MVITFDDNPNATIISCSSPTNVSEEMDRIAYKLFPLLCNIQKHNVPIIGGDMNAQIDKNVNNKFSLHNSSNSNGEHLTDFMLENRLTCLNTKFQKRERKLWTYTYTNNTKAQIDYIFINKKWNNRALKWEAYSFFKGVSSNHQIVMAEIQLSLRRNAARTTTTVHYDWSLLYNRDIRDKYMLTLRNKFDTLQEIPETPTVNDEYENFVNAHLEAAELCIPTKQRAKPRVPWETLVVRKKHEDVKIGSLHNKRIPTNINTQKLKAQNELTNEYLKEQTEYIQNQINKIRESVEDRQSRIAWQMVNEVSRRKSTARAKLKQPAKKNEYTCGNNIFRIYLENVWKLSMNQSQKLLIIN